MKPLMLGVLALMCMPLFADHASAADPYANHCSTCQINPHYQSHYVAPVHHPIVERPACGYGCGGCKTCYHTVEKTYTYKVKVAYTEPKTIMKKKLIKVPRQITVYDHKWVDEPCEIMVTKYRTEDRVGTYHVKVPYCPTCPEDHPHPPADHDHPHDHPHEHPPVDPDPDPDPPVIQSSKVESELEKVGVIKSAKTIAKAVAASHPWMNIVAVIKPSVLLESLAKPAT